MVWSRKASAFSLALFFIGFTFLLWGPLQARAMEDTAWKEVLQYFQGLFRSASMSLEGYKAQQKKDLKAFKKAIGKLEKKKGQLMIWFGASYDPNNLRYILRGIRSLRGDAQSLYRPFDQESRDVENAGFKLDELEAEMKRQLENLPTADFTPALDKSLQELSELKTWLAVTRSLVEKAREPYTSFMTRLDEAERSTSQKIGGYWKIFYLETLTSVFSPDTWGAFGSDVGEWVKTKQLLAQALSGGKEREDLRDALIEGLLLTLGLMGLGWNIFRRALGSHETRGRHMRLFTAWSLFSIFVSLQWVNGDVPFMLYPSLAAICEMLFAASMVVVGRVVLPKGKSQEYTLPGICWLLWLLLSVGLLFKAFLTPYVIVLPFWIVSLVSFSWVLRRRVAKASLCLEGIMARLVPYMTLALALLAAFGYLPLSMSLFACLFYFVVTIHIGMEIIGGIKRWEERARDQGTPLLLIGCITGVVFPSVIVFLIVINVWFLSLRLGGERTFLSIFSMEAAWQGFHMSLTSVAFMLMAYYLTQAAIFISDSYIRRLSRRRAGLDMVVVETLLMTTRYVLWGSFTFCVLSLLGFSLTSLTVVAGGLSVGIGFGLQHIVNNLISGLILLLGRMIQSGDTIQVADILGDVRKVTIRTTQVQTRENATVFIPNSDLISSKLINWSHRDCRVIREILVGVAYGSDTCKVRELLCRAPTKSPHVIPFPLPEVLFWAFGASTLDFKVRVWIDDVRNENQILSEVRFEIDRLFRENGVEIAFPQTDMHIRTAPALEKLLASKM